MFAPLATSERIQVQWWDPDEKSAKGKRWKYAGRFTRQEIESDPDIVGNRFGGGSYRFTAITPDDKCGGSMEWAYDEAAFGGHKRNPDEPAEPVVAPLDVAAAIRDGIALGLKEAMAKTATGPVDPIAQFTALATAMKSIMPAPVAVDPDRGIDLFLRGISEGRALAGGAAPGEDTGDLVKKALGGLAGFLDNKFGGNPAPGAPAAPAGTQPAPPSPAADGNGGTNGMSPYVGMIVDKVIGLARSNTLPEIAAQDILAMIPQTFFEQFAAMVRTTDLAATVLQLRSDAGQFGGWLKQVQEHLKAVIEEVEKTTAQ